jgi:uridine kinase
MHQPELFTNLDLLSETLFEKMKQVNPAIAEMELYEFRYGLNNLYPEPGGWAGIQPESREAIEECIHSTSFYESIQLKPRKGDQIVLDSKILHLTHMLLVGLINGDYSPEWVRAHFYFDIRGFYFLTRTPYFTNPVLANFGGKPYRQFEQRQKDFEYRHEIGYKAFREANTEVDECFIACVQKLIAVKGTPILLAIAGPTAAGKTEIVERLRKAFEAAGQKTASIEMDNFLTDREQREAKGIHSFGKQAIHFGLFLQSLHGIIQGQKITMPRYNFIDATSSHDLEGHLKAGGVAIEIEPADIVFLEGNFPFLLAETFSLIGIKVVYLTDDPVRLQRKWRRDVDYRKKYEPTYLRNRYFRDQFLMAQKCLRPQMEVCDILVDTTGAALWVTPETVALLDRH